MKGFSLMEMLVYLGLLSLLLTGSIASAYALAEYAGRYRTETLLERDGRFMLHTVRAHLQNGESERLVNDLETLTIYDVSDVKVQSGGSGNASTPFYTDVSFTLSSHEQGVPLQRLFSMTFYPHAP